VINGSKRNNAFRVKQFLEVVPDAEKINVVMAARARHFASVVCKKYK
jgi:hypothetical protein